jgi:hypothetical protein
MAVRNDDVLNVVDIGMREGKGVCRLARGCQGGRPKEGKNYYYLPKTLAKLLVNNWGLAPADQCNLLPENWH